MSVAILGTGIMGGAMAQNLVRSGFRTMAWDRSTSATSRLAEAGVHIVTSAPDSVRDANVVITMCCRRLTS